MVVRVQRITFNVHRGSGAISRVGGLEGMNLKTRGNIVFVFFFSREVDDVDICGAVIFRCGPTSGSGK